MQNELVCAEWHTRSRDMKSRVGTRSRETLNSHPTLLRGMLLLNRLVYPNLLFCTADKISIGSVEVLNVCKI